jgi:hypothetical protein
MGLSTYHERKAQMKGKTWAVLTILTAFAAVSDVEAGCLFRCRGHCHWCATGGSSNSMNFSQGQQQSAGAMQFTWTPAANSQSAVQQSVDPVALIGLITQILNRGGTGGIVGGGTDQLNRIEEGVKGLKGEMENFSGAVRDMGKDVAGFRQTLDTNGQLNQQILQTLQSIEANTKKPQTPATSSTAPDFGSQLTTAIDNAKKKSDAAWDAKVKSAQAAMLKAANEALKQ